MNMIKQLAEQSPGNSDATVNYCFLNPAWMPDWFWLPAAHAIAESGANYCIPPLERDVMTADMERNVDIVAAAMDDEPSQYIVALSRGVEYAVRYLDRMAKQGRLANIVGWTVISSAGPSGYETRLDGFGGIPYRHTKDYMAGIALDESGLEVFDPAVAHACMFHDIGDRRLLSEVMDNLTKARPLTTAEIESVPYIEAGGLPLAWYIGKNDKVDDPEVSAAIARKFFHAEPTLTDWGHIGPLTHTEEVVETLLMDTQKALALRSMA